MPSNRVPLKKLHPAPWNPRTIRDSRFENLCRSLEADPEFMLLRPVLATLDGTIYAGNMRYRAAAHLGWTDIEARLTDIPEQLAKERALRDNAGWGENVDEALGTLLAELKDAGSDIDLLGFDSGELDRLLAGVQQIPEEDPADLEPPSEPITKPGDLWLLGEHRLLCGDSTNLTDVERLMNGRKADMVFTDPPYGMSYKGTTFGKNGLENDAESEFETVARDAFVLLPTVLNDGVVAVCFGSSRLDALFRAAEGLHFHRLLTIYKPNRMAHPWHGWVMTQEHILLFSHGSPRFNDVAHCHDVYTFDYSERPAREVDHPTVKPLSIVTDVVAKCSQRGDLVLDSFGGSGTTLIAAEQIARVAYLMEIDPGYCDVICNRWERLTGKTAVLETAPTATPNGRH